MHADQQARPCERERGHGHLRAVNLSKPPDDHAANRLHPDHQEPQAEDSTTHGVGDQHLDAVVAKHLLLGVPIKQWGNRFCELLVTQFLVKDIEKSNGLGSGV